MSSKNEADFAKMTQAYKDLVEAEKTAATLEAQLSSLEQKIDNFLTEHDKQQGVPSKNNDALSAAAGEIDEARELSGP